MIAKKTREVQLDKVTVTNSVKSDLKSWISEGCLVEQLKKIVTSSESKDSDTLRALELTMKYAGLDFETKEDHVESTHNMNNVSFEELKSIWIHEIKKNNVKSMEENVNILQNRDKLSNFIKEESQEINVVID